MTLGQASIGTTTLNGTTTLSGTTSVTTLNSTSATTAMNIGNNLTGGGIAIANGAGFTGGIAIGAGSLVRTGTINIGTGGSGAITIGNSTAPLTLVGSTITSSPLSTTGLNVFKTVFFGNFNINTNSSGNSSAVTLPSLSAGVYIVTLGTNNFQGDANLTIVLDIVISANSITGIILRSTGATRSFGVALGTFSGLTFNLINVNYPPNYNPFDGRYYPLCVFV